VIPRKPAGIIRVNVIFFFTGSARISDVARTFERHERSPEEGERSLGSRIRRGVCRRFDAREMNSQLQSRANLTLPRVTSSRTGKLRKNNLAGSRITRITYVNTKDQKAILSRHGKNSV